MVTESASSQGIEADGKQLLPGIPNDIVLVNISAKLSWKDLLVLSTVSRTWHAAIRSREVYDARVRSHSAETLMLLKYSGHASNSVYLLGNKWYLKLPPIPCLGGDIPRGSRCVPLDGKIYVLGGEQERYGPASDKVFVLDVAGQRLWKECATIQRPRKYFGCGVVGGKIYLCGGSSSYGECSSKLSKQTKLLSKLTGESEVYDPETGVWKSIAPMKSLRCTHSVDTVGEELFVHGGRLVDGKIDSEGRMRLDRALHWRTRPRPVVLNEHFLEVYNPGRDEWRIVQPYAGTRDEGFFSARGRFFSLTRNREENAIHDIHVLDAGEQSWTHFHSFSLVGLLGPLDSILGFEMDVLFVDDELVAKLRWYVSDPLLSTHHSFVESIGFGSANKEITWKKLQSAPRAFDFPVRESPFVRYPIKL